MQRNMLLLASALCAVVASAQDGPDGQRVFIENCAACHRDQGGGRAPEPETLAQMTQTAIVEALERGVMKPQGLKLSPEQRRAVAAYLSRHDQATPEITTGFCSGEMKATAEPGWNGWGANIENTRYQSGVAGRLTGEEVPKLKLKWAFGFPGGTTSSQPAVFGNRLYIGGPKGVYSLDAPTGCIHWIFKQSASVRAAVTLSQDGATAYFADANADTFAVETATGALKWKTKVDPNPIARITAAPLLVENRIYVAVSSGEEGAAINPYYECCRFRGSLVALEEASGKQLWKTYAIPEEPHKTGKNAKGALTWGPSGAPIWAAPAADVKRHILYVATGNNYSDPPDSHSDAIMAISMENGKVLWWKQLLSGDRWNLACLIKIDLANCPPNAGDDWDFGAGPMVVTLSAGRSLVVAAQKSGMTYALDPDHEGKLVWERRVGKGGDIGGVEWGAAAGDGVAYFPVSDWKKGIPNVGGGLWAVRLESGEPVWHVEPVAPDCTRTAGCSQAQVGPATLIPGAVFSGSLDGHMRAYDTRNGKILWDFNTAQSFKTVDGIDAHGGSMGPSGPAIANGMVFLNSGHSLAMSGNVLLAFAPAEP